VGRTSRPISGDRGGRPAITIVHQLSVVAQRLFVDRGFERTSIEHIAEAAGISRRSFFRYFSSKADVLFAESAADLARLREGLGAGRPADPYRAVVTRAVVAALTFSPEDREWAWQRAQLILTVPALQAHASMVFAEWRHAAREYAQTRPGADEVFGLAVGHAVLAASLGAHEYWIARPDSDLGDVLARLLALLLPPEPDASGAGAG